MPDWKQETRLAPLDVYLAIIKFMTLLGMQPYEGRVDMKKIATVDLPDTRVTIANMSRSVRLQPRHLLITLYTILYEMYSGRPGFFKAACNIFFNLELMGTIYILDNPPRPTVSGSQNVTTTEPDEKEGAISLVSSPKALTDDSGIVVDPKDAKFRISWNAVGRSIPAVQDMFSAAVDGIFKTAKHPYDSFCTHFTGISFSGAVAFHVGELSAEKVTCGQMARAFFLLVELVIKDERVFQEMDYSLEYDGLRIASGFILRVTSVESHGGNSTGEIVTS